MLHHRNIVTRLTCRPTLVIYRFQAESKKELESIIPHQDKYAPILFAP